MRIRYLLSLLTLLFFSGCQKDFDEASPPSTEGAEILDQEIRMELDRETADAINITRTRSGKVVTGNISFDELCERYHVIEMKRLFDDNGCAERTRKAGLDLWYTIRFEGPASQIMEDFEEVPGVMHVETPLRVSRIQDTENTMQMSPAREVMFSSHAVPADYPFNDPLFGGQWPLYNDGSVYREAVAGADINVIPAWKKSAGRNDVIVAVLDEGVQYDHPDLAANMWSGIGKNFCSVDNSTITWGKGHGTHVAGTIAAVSNNGIGISGVAGGTGNGDGVKIMSCQIFHPTNGRRDATSSEIAVAFKYAADNGAVICQNSWGYNAGIMSESQWATRDRALKNAIDYFIKYAGMSPDGETQTGPMAGGVVIFASGNEHSPLTGYPGSYSPCINVSSISCSYEAAYYTNYGPTIDICAPGGGRGANFAYRIDYDQGYNLSTLPTNLKNGDRFTYRDSNSDQSTVTIDYISTTVGYGYMQGTSMACPHVSGVAALIASHYGGPGFTNEHLKVKLLATGRDIDSYQGKTNGSPDTYAGKIGKLVDAGAALDSDDVLPEPAQPRIILTAGQNDTFTMTNNGIKTLRYILTDYTDWSLIDPTGKIEKSIAKNAVTLTIDGSQYAVGDYTAELQAVNGTKSAKRTITYTITRGNGPTLPTPNPDPTVISMDFYPNPCTDVLNMLADRPCEGTIRVKNSVGMEVMNLKFAFASNIPVKIDVSQLVAGVYMLEATYNNTTISRTIVKR